MELRGTGSPYNAASRFIDDRVTQGLANKTAVYYRDQAITYGELALAVNRAGNLLKDLSVEMENRVLLLLYDTPAFIESFYGAIKIGAVPIPVNTAMSPADYEYFLNNSRAKVLIVHQSLWEPIRHLRERFIFLKHVVVIQEGQETVPDVLDYSALSEAASADLKQAPTNYNDSAFWLYSSGSTGNPKGIVHLQHDMECSLDTYARNILEIGDNDITFSASKLYFAYGMGGGMYFPLGAGASTVLLKERSKPDCVLETIEKYRPTIFFGVPTLYAAMIDLTERSSRKYDLSSLRVCVSAGEALPSQFLKRWKELYGLDILDGIGSTEAAHIFISNRVGDIRPGSTGKAVPGYEARIVNEAGNEAAPGEVGDLVIKGESLAQGYWNLHEENKVKFKGEWLNTGDKYYKDDDGYFWYYGRSDDMLKVSGIWVSPIEIENALVKHASVLEAAVIGVTLENDLVQSKAFVVLKEGFTAGDELRAELQAFVKSELAAYKYPRIIEFVSELPKTASGKIQRFKLRIG